MHDTHCRITMTTEWKCMHNNNTKDGMDKSASVLDDDR